MMTTTELIIEGAVKEILEALIPESSRPGLKETPARVARSLKEMTQGYTDDPKTILKLFDEGITAPVALGGIRFTSMCEHHMLPFVGTADIGYLPHNGKAVGISKLVRLVDCFSKRFQVQERMTEQIAKAIIEHVSPDVAVVVRAHHTCMGCRGVKQPDAIMTSSVMLGKYRSEASLRMEFFAMLRES